MDKPESFDAEHIRAKRADVLYRLILASVPELVRGQYKGFLDEKGINTGSQTETYFKAIVQVNNRRWKGVPVILESGKGMKESKTEIKIHFKKTLGAEPNTICFRIQPNEGIDLNFWVKKPGFEQELTEQRLSFSYPTAEPLPDAYERVLYDCFRGDQTLFASTDEVTYSWKFITPTLERLQQEPLMPYTKHTNGPLTSN